MAKRKFRFSKKVNKQINKLISLVLALIISALLAKFTFLDTRYQPVIGKESGRTVKVSDGDTVTILSAEKREVKIRLYGIDAPESKQPHGEAARSALAALVAGQQMEADVLDVDQYGRSVGLIKTGGADINGQMVADGHAWVYPNYCKIEECAAWKDAQAAAKAQRKGLWKAKNPQPPWQWRKENK